MQKLLNTREVADLLGISPNTLDIWRTKNRGPRFIKVGRYVRYQQTDLENFIKDNKRGPSDTEN
ncbi:MAG: DNA-binding protein [Porticoccaceae bacterium]|jgi:predicted DNA-binding transcriptional regulator AlpA|nr:DNA-binding protein [Porticoccaceae bacterium]